MSLLASFGLYPHRRPQQEAPRDDDEVPHQQCCHCFRLFRLMPKQTAIEFAGKGYYKSHPHLSLKQLLSDTQVVNSYQQHLKMQSIARRVNTPLRYSVGLCSAPTPVPLLSCGSRSHRVPQRPYQIHLLRSAPLVCNQAFSPWSIDILVAGPVCCRLSCHSSGAPFGVNII